MTNYAINLIWFTYDAANHTHKKENGKTEKPPVWKRFTVDDIFCLWDTKKEDVELFIEEANVYHPTHIKFTQGHPTSIFGKYLFERRFEI